MHFFFFFFFLHVGWTGSLESSCGVYANRKDMGRTIKLDSDLYFVKANIRDLEPTANFSLSVAPSCSSVWVKKTNFVILFDKSNPNYGWWSAKVVGGEDKPRRLPARVLEGWMAAG